MLGVPVLPAYAVCLLLAHELLPQLKTPAYSCSGSCCPSAICLQHA